MTNLNEPVQLPEGVLKGISDAAHGEFASKDEIRSAFVGHTAEEGCEDK